MSKSLPNDNAAKTNSIIGDVVFLFGAGASFAADTGQISPERPPLIRDLYNRLAQRFPSEWGTSSIREKSAEEYRKDFEKAFTEIDLKRRPDNPPGVAGVPGLSAVELQRTLAVYFSEFRLGSSGEDLYSRLLKYLRRSGIIETAFFATLNYECLFEQAVRQQALPLDYLIDAARKQLKASAGEDWPGPRQEVEQVYLAKLHGSCNFTIPKVDIQFFRTRASTQGTIIGTGIDTLDPFVQLSNMNEGDIWPVMTQTSPNRDDFAGGTLIQQMRNMWSIAARRSKLLLIIGVGPRNYDQHILDPIRAASNDVAYIGCKADLTEWRRCNPKIRFLNEDFRRGFLRLLLLMAKDKRQRGGSAFDYLLNVMRACWT